MNETCIQYTASEQLTRRNLLKRVGVGAAALASLSALTPSALAAITPVPGFDRNDIDLLNLLLNIEYLEAQFFTHAADGTGLNAAGVSVSGVGPVGRVTLPTPSQVPFSSATNQAFAQELASNEQAHVLALRQLLGSAAASMPNINLDTSFTTAARDAGLITAPDTFNPFINDNEFLYGAFMLEDLSVTAYRAVLPALISKSAQNVVAGIMAAEGYHAATIRSQIYQAGVGPQDIANALAANSAALDGTSTISQPLSENNNANITPVNGNGMVPTRSVQQVLNNLYLAQGATKGGFFPNGINQG